MSGGGVVGDGGAGDRHLGRWRFFVSLVMLEQSGCGSDPERIGYEMRDICYSVSVDRFSAIRRGVDALRENCVFYHVVSNAAVTKFGISHRHILLLP